MGAEAVMSMRRQRIDAWASSSRGAVGAINVPAAKEAQRLLVRSANIVRDLVLVAVEDVDAEMRHVAPSAHGPRRRG